MLGVSVSIKAKSFGKLLLLQLKLKAWIESFYWNLIQKLDLKLKAEASNELEF